MFVVAKGGLRHESLDLLLEGGVCLLLLLEVEDGLLELLLHFGETLGLLVGLLGKTVLLLFGILTTQIYMYYLAFPKDRRLLKLAVAWVYVVGTVQIIVTLVDINTALRSTSTASDPYDSCYGVAIATQGNIWFTITTSSAAVALVAQWLYAYRIYVISYKLWISILIICLSLGQLGSSILGSFCSYRSSVEVENMCTSGFDRVWGPLNLLCDVTITLSMSILLLRRRKGTLKRTTHARITKVIRLVVETGLATSMTSHFVHRRSLNSI